MFRAQVLRRNLSLYNRVSSSQLAHSAARNGHETITVQRFRIRKPFISRSRLVGIVAVSWATYAAIQYLGLEVEIEVVDKQQKKAARPGDAINNGDKTSPEWETATGQDEHDDDDDYDYEHDNVLLFLPTGFSRQAPRESYKGTDPEWEQFRMIAKDQVRINRIRGELATMVRTSNVVSAGFGKLVGKVDASKGKYWLDVNFPLVLPPTYERPGIELTEDLEWRRATRPVDFVTHQRLTRLFFPSAVGEALYEDTKRKAAQSWKGFRAYMGWGEKPSQLETLQDLVRQLPAKTTSTTRPSASSIVTTAPNSSPKLSPINTQQTTASPSPPSDSPAQDIGLVMPRAKDLTLNLIDFRKDVSKSLGPYHPTPPRGCFILQGMVEVIGDRGRMTVQVKAIYDPKEGKYVDCKASPLNVTPYRQRPKDGH